MKEPFERLRLARLRAGYDNATDAARAFGWNEVTYRAHEIGTRGLKPRIAEQYAKAFRVKAGWLLHGDEPEPGIANLPGTGSSLPPPNADFSRVEEELPLHSYRRKRDVPVLGIVVGGKNGDDDFRLNGEIVDYAPRISGIENKKDVYGLWVVGSSMEPKFEEGDMIYVDPHRAPAILDYVVIQVLPKEDGENAEGYIKRLIRRTPTKIIVGQFNPPREIEFDRDKVKVHRVIPMMELLGS